MLAGAGRLAEDHLDARMRRNRFSNLCNVGFGATMTGAQLGTVVWCGYGILTGTMSFGTLTAMAPLGERGAGLSEGQSQRLAVARAIFSGSPVLLLDEATSALDGATEVQLLRNLRSLADRTVVVVTHRPAALELCDRAIEFDG